MKTETKLLISVNGQELTVSFADSTAAQELTEKLIAEPVTITLNEYADLKKSASCRGRLPEQTQAPKQSRVTSCFIRAIR